MNLLDIKHGGGPACPRCERRGFSSHHKKKDHVGEVCYVVLILYVGNGDEPACPRCERRGFSSYYTNQKRLGGRFDLFWKAEAKLVLLLRNCAAVVAAVAAWSLRSLGASSGYLGHSSNVHFDAFNPNVSGRGIRRLHARVRAGLERGEPTLCVGHCHAVASCDLGDLRGVRLQAPDPQRSGDTTIYGGATSNRGCD